MSTAFQLGRIIGLLALGVLLAGCSTIKLGYNSLPDVGYWWLDGYLDFTDDQKPRMRDDLARLHQWHRGAELPRWVELLDRAQQLAPGDITPAQACEVIDEGRQRLLAVANQAEPSVVALALTLTPQQLEHLERRYERNNHEFRKEWIKPTAAERQAHRLKQFIERSEKVYGRLDDAQRAALGRQLEHSVFDPEKVLAERQHRQAQLLRTLRQLQAPGMPPAEARSLMRSYFDQAAAATDTGWRQHQEVLLQEACRIIAASHNAMTREQRQTAVQRLQGWRRDLADLSAQP